ncbi:SDR family oxidoreductase [Isoptericola aurantiacus]|uniref:SDR family oxidoreductase n=1 Tax=Isoptericola aurantiacus TaxID=3377839 RepID=UPI003839E7D3
MKTWFITGTSKGFGRVWAEAALERGDQVVATARNLDSIADLAERYPDTALTVTLDVTDRDAVLAAVAQAKDRFGRIDIAINNAGFGVFGTVEEVSDAQARAQMDTNVFGALSVTQAVLPIMREQGAGHIIQVSSVGGVHAFPNLGIYHASKWALEGFSQSLAAEVAGFGIKVTLVEPGGYGTDWGTASAVHADPNPAYQPLRDAMAARRGSTPQGDPVATGPVILQLVDMDQPPLRFFLGKGLAQMIRAEYDNRLTEWDTHAELSQQA